jgi:hypothetical protein
VVRRRECACDRSIEAYVIGGGALVALIVQVPPSCYDIIGFVLFQIHHTKLLQTQNTLLLPFTGVIIAGEVSTAR